MLTGGSGPASFGAMDRVHTELRRQIISGQRPPDSVLSQVQIAHDLHVSLTPVREALRRLQEEGLVRGERHRRMRVVSFRPDEFEYVYASRITLGSLALVATLPHFSRAEIEQLQHSVQEMQTGAELNRAADWEAAHARFHALLACHAPEPVQDALARLTERSNLYRQLWRGLGDEWRNDASHDALLASCCARDSRAAVDQLARHFARTALSVMAALDPERDPSLVRNALRMALASSSALSSDVPQPPALAVA